MLGSLRRHKGTQTRGEGLPFQEGLWRDSTRDLSPLGANQLGSYKTWFVQLSGPSKGVFPPFVRC